MKYQYFMGIDVGKSGALVLINNNRNIIECIKTPEEATYLLEFLKGYSSEELICNVEKVGGRFGDAAFSAFNFGFTCGEMNMALVASKINHKYVTPKEWQKYYDMKRDTKGKETATSWKNRLKERAMKEFPAYAKQITLWNADALLIAGYCLFTHG